MTGVRREREMQIQTHREEGSEDGDRDRRDAREPRRAGVASHLQKRGERISLAATFFETSGLQSCETIISVVLSCPVWVVLWGQP